MNPEIHMSEYEQLVYDEYSRMNLGTDPEDDIEQVTLTFTQVTDESDKSFEYDIKNDGTLILYIEYTSIEDGIKYALAKMASARKSSYYIPFRLFFAPFIIPFISSLIPLIIIREFGLGNLFLSLILGPGLYICIALPFILICTKKKMHTNSIIRQRIRAPLEKSSLYTKNEIEEYTSTFTKYLSINHVYDYIFFIPVLFIFIWTVIFLH